MIIDNYCIGLFLIVLFLLYIDNKNNLEGYAELSELKDNSLITQDDSKYIEPNQEEATKKYVPIGLKPQKLEMKPPSSISGSLEMLAGAPINKENYMLLNKDITMGVKTMDSKLTMPYPRVGGVGNMGNGFKQDPVVGNNTVTGKPSGSNSIKAVIIYAPWCGWSKKSLPDFKKMDSTLNSVQPNQTNGWNVSAKIYNSETPEGKAKAKELNVKGFPSVFVDVNGTSEEGPRKYEEMINLINSKTGGNIQA